VSARSTINVLAFEMSSPVSTMVVHTRMSKSRFQKPSTVFSRASSFIWPCATTTGPRAHGLHPGGGLVDRLARLWM
jgi:hypothetical protein